MPEENPQNEHALECLKTALQALQDAKPNDRSELDRRYAVSITELEKMIAYFYLYVILT